MRTATIEEMVDADAVVIAAGRGGRPGESQLALLRENAALIADLGARLSRAPGMIGLVTADLLRCILRDERRVLPVSRVQEGVLGLTDVALSLPAVVGARGAADVLTPEISADEHNRLHHSAGVLRQAAAAAGPSP